MKVIIHSKGFVLQGKAWEVKAKLKEYSNKFTYVEDWIKAANDAKQ